VVHLFSTVRTNCDDVTVMSRRTELVHPVAKNTFTLDSGHATVLVREKGLQHPDLVTRCVGLCGWMFGGRRERKKTCARKVTSSNK
jgi:hypothetical protein